MPSQLCLGSLVEHLSPHRAKTTMVEYHEKERDKLATIQEKRTELCKKANELKDRCKQLVVTIMFVKATSDQAASLSSQGPSTRTRVAQMHNPFAILQIRCGNNRK